jgi:RHS repeat-associated protein
LVDREMTYNRAGVRKTERRWDEAGLTDSYAYDSLYRLSRSDYDDDGGVGSTPRDLQRHDYLLDGVGSRRSVDALRTSTGTSTTPFAVNQVNEYVTVGGVPWVYSDNGNLREDGVRAYSYDYKNRLVRIANATTTVQIAEYRYDAENRRTEKLVGPAGAPTSLSVFAWDGFQVCEERDAFGAATATFVYHPVYLDEPVQMLRTAAHPSGAGQVWLHQNARADVVVGTNAVGLVTDRLRYDDFGNADGSAPSGSPFRFQGLWYDAESGLCYARNRYYDPRVGRFLQRDPVWDAANVGGWYTFGGSSPVSTRDPMGLQQEAVDPLLLRASAILHQIDDLIAQHQHRSAGDQIAVLRAAHADLLDQFRRSREDSGQVDTFDGLNLLHLAQIKGQHGLSPEIEKKLDLKTKELQERINKGCEAAKSFGAEAAMASVPLFVRRADDIVDASRIARAGDAVQDGARIASSWGHNRVVKELHDQGFIFDRATRSGGGQLYRNPRTGAEVRIMPRPGERFRHDPPAKHETDYYYRSRSGPDQPWGPHTSIPND